MHGTRLLACHGNKNEPRGHDFWPCRCYSACESFILFGDPELRPSIGLSGLQGPHQIKEKLEKERSELRDLVSCGVVNLNPLGEEKGNTF